MDELIFLSGRQKGRHVPLERRRMTTGRERTNDIPVEDEAASRLHAVIEHHDGEFWLVDNQSTNGTFLNDRRIDRVALKSGDRIGIGDTVMMVNLSERRETPTVVFSDLQPDDIAMNVRLDTSTSKFLVVDPKILDETTQQSFLQLYEFTTEVSGTLQTERVLDIMLEHIFKTTRADRAFVLLLDEEGRIIPRRSRIRSTGESEELVKPDDEIKLPRTMINYVLETAEALLTMDAASDARFSQSQSVSRLQINSVMVTPLKIKDKMLGLVYVDTIRQAAVFSEMDLKLLTAMSIECAVCLENARLYEELMNSLEYSATILRSLSSGIIVVDPGGTITRLNDAALEILKMEERDLIGHAIREFEQFRELSQLMAQTLRSTQKHDRREIVISVGEEDVPVGVGTSVLANHTGRVIGVIANFRNISHLKRMAEQVRKNQYLASLGEMSAGVAHEIRNPLNSIRGFAQLLAERTEKSENRQYAQIVLEEVDRMNGIVQEMLDFSRSRSLTLVSVDVGALVQRVITEMQVELESGGVITEIEVEPDLPKIMGNPDKLHQVFTNIIKNGAQAMSDGGKLSITAGMPAGEKAVSVCIRDEGHGIEKGVIKRVFDPFFTTKDVGTGLGLSICLKIIEQHGGRIDIESEPEQGAAFTVVLPVEQ